jgi:hypothetical protein
MLVSGTNAPRSTARPPNISTRIVMEHGFAKLARGLDAFPAILQALGVPAPHLMGWLTKP